MSARAAADTSDRSGERGRLRAWASGNADQLVGALGDDHVLYAEWLRRRHAVAYDRLPSELVGLDIMHAPSRRFLSIDERDTVLARTGVGPPPRRFRGTLTSLDRLDQLLGASAFADVRAEGLVVRTADGSAPRIASVDPDWCDIGSTEWCGENRIASRSEATA